MTAGDLIGGKWQVEWRGQLLGFPGTSLAITDVQGWLKKPPTRSNPTDRPGQHGQIPSDLKAQSRLIDVEFADLDDDPTGFRTLLDTLALGEGDVMEPLVIYLDDQPQLAYARCELDDIPTDYEYSLGYRRATMHFVASDPRRYSVDLYTLSVGLPVPLSGGLSFPLVFPLDFGAGRSTSQLAIANAGNAPSWPVLTVTGPTAGPIITNADTGELLRFNPAFSLGAGETVMIDTLAKTVLLGSGPSRRSELYVADWFSLAAKATTHITFAATGAYDPGALLTVAWRDASL